MKTHANPTQSHTSCITPSLKWTMKEYRGKDMWLPLSSCRLLFLDCWSPVTIVTNGKTKEKKHPSEDLPDACCWVIPAARNATEMKMSDVETARYGRQTKDYGHQMFSADVPQALTVCTSLPWENEDWSVVWSICQVALWNLFCLFGGSV